MFKKRKVVMLPTNQKASDKPFSTGITLCNDGKLRIGNPVGKSESRQHLYITSDEEIKEGNWSLYEYVKPHIVDIPMNGDHKIIATTDKSLEIAKDVKSEYCNNSEVIGCILPQPSQSFIDKYISEYNKGNIITDVMVEYFIKQHNQHSHGIWNEEILKVSKDNTITIKRIKDSWNREGVSKKIFDFNKWRKDVGNLGQDEPKLICDWIEQNL